MMQFYDLVDVLNECSRKVPSLYVSSLIADVSNTFTEYFEDAVESLEDKEKLKLLGDCAITLVVLLTNTRKFDDAMKLIEQICEYEGKLGVDRTCASYLLLIRDAVNTDAQTNVLMLQSVFLKYNSDHNDLVRAYVWAMAFFRRYE